MRSTLTDQNNIIMEELERLQKQRELIEFMGIQSEKEGFQPATARVMALLIVSDKEEFTFEDIVEELELSKSSVSVALKNLMIRDIIEYVTYTGDRKRYFRFMYKNSDQFIEDMEQKVAERIKYMNLVVDLKKDPKSKSALFLKNVADSLEFFNGRIKELHQILKDREYN